MSSFSSVVRKPGQKITPKTAPRRNVQRQSARPTAPPSLTPESHAASPARDSVGDHASSQEDAQVSTVLESTELPTDIESADASLPVLESVEAPSTPVPDSPRLNRTPSVVASVEIPAPPRPTELSAAPRLEAIPAVRTTKSNKSRRRETNEPTPGPSEDSDREAEVGAELDQAERNALSPRKRRKTIHTDQTKSAARPSPTPSISDSAALILGRRSRTARSGSRTSDALLQDATSQAAAVSELANSIENRARSLGAQSAPPSSAGSIDTTPEPAKQTKKRKRAKRIAQAAKDVVTNAIRGGRYHSRQSTPENAEELQIDPEEVAMDALIRDTKVGRKSETEKKMQENWDEIQKRRKEEVVRRREAAGQGRHGRQALGTVETQAEEIHAPQQIIVNGQIVVAAESREVAFGAGVEQAVIEDADVALEDDRIYKYVNQGTVGKYAGLRRGNRWDDEKTELFYKGLRWFGTDFSMIAPFFPQFERRQVKLKYTIELRANPERVQESVTAKEPVDMDEYMQLTEQDFIDPATLQAELDAEEKRLREEDDQRREREGFIKDPADIALPTTEQDDNDGEAAEPTEDESDTHQPSESAHAARLDRISALAEQVVNAAVAPKKKNTQQQQQQQARKARDSASVRGRQRKKSRMPLEGVEERIGPINEVG
ncbi:hypothetical protein LTR84_006180 [Exophiala bonariae]|uniref:Transcription factor TFIIIB component B'' Myb domain-containing protein n=1 Tax=Exophiala bonariae TaxID=1690606 RepID=A0AAV9N1S0_9EURO|nr:hypothetical protein LTR84_006180 [Exophiala bonariae]